MTQLEIRRIRRNAIMWLIANKIFVFLNVVFASYQFSVANEFLFLLHCGFAAYHIMSIFNWLGVILATARPD